MRHYPPATHAVGRMKRLCLNGTSFFIDAEEEKKTKNGYIPSIKTSQINMDDYAHTLSLVNITHRP